MPEKLQTFLVNIAIIEGRHFVWPNMNSAAIVKIDNQKKCTAVKFHTANPYYNEYFVFEFLSTLENIIDKNVTITVIKPGSIVSKRKTLGSTTFDVGTIWYQEDHQLYHKWAILTAPSKDFAAGTRGYLKLDVSVLTKGELLKTPVIATTDDIEGNLFLPRGNTTERQKINFIFDIYRATDLVKKNSIVEGAKRIDSPNAHIEVSFSGQTVKTTTKKSSSKPVWNERLVLPELFPPLCQRFKIDLYHDGAKRATRHLEMHTISSDKQEGFLPTFGPSFLHFYSPNHLEGYLGKVLLSLNSVLVDDMAEYESKVQLAGSDVSPLREDYLIQYENMVLFGAVFEVSSIVRKFGDKTLSFRLSCGLQQIDDNGDNAMVPLTPSMKPKIVNKNYCHLPIAESKPCVHLTLALPDVRKRMFNYNLLTKMLKELKQRLDQIVDVFHNKEYDIASTETESLLFETLDFISTSAAKYVDIASNYFSKTDPLLDHERLKMSLKEIEAIMHQSNEIPRDLSKKKVFRKIEKFYSRIQALIDIIEDWPQIYLWMIYGNKRVAHCIIQPRNVIHSPVDEEKGTFCGVLRSIHFQTEEHQYVPKFISSVCKMDIMLWLGLPRHLSTFVPSGFGFSSETIPRTLMAEEIHVFQARAHIFQGRFTPGMDKSGLCDPFVQVIIGSQFRQTEILKKVLTPVWDQSLIFQKIVLYGSSEFIRANPPSVYFEVYDKDDFTVEPVGKCVVKPVVKIIEDPYAPPKFPPKLSWLKVSNKFDIGAEILAVVELLELSNDVENQEDDSIVRVPPDIKPNLTNYRVEVLFWGVRNLKRVQMGQITKPKIVIECGSVTLTSDTLINARKNLNFTNPARMFEVTFPEEKEYVPPLSLKMFDCRNFGINAFAGVHVAPVLKFIVQPLTAAEREAIIMNIPQKSLLLSPSIELAVKKIEKEFPQMEPVEKVKNLKKKSRWKRFMKKICCKKDVEVPPQAPAPVEVATEAEIEDTSDFDWWTKFYASLEETPPGEKIPLSHRYKLKVYENELETQLEFSGFTDTLVSFPLYKGKKTGDEGVDEENTTGIFKGAVRIYKWPLSDSHVTLKGLPLKNGIFQDFPSNSPLRYVLRVYCIRGLNLRPKDLSGKSDPYIRVTLSEQIISDRDNRVMGQVNPVFGRCFEMNGVFPQDHTLQIDVMDYDAATSDDLIGQTKIDLENRFYSKHRGHCGLAQDYLTSGYCHWRDQQKPATILENLCKKFMVPLQYEPNFVRVASREFCPENFASSDNPDFDRQVLALEALKHWSEIPIVGSTLVPEHVETRALYNPQIPGVAQGKLQVWIDILPCGDLPTPKQVHIAPRKPVTYELRVIVWNAQNIILDEKDFFTGEQKSDVFFKGWMIMPEDAQYTDVHYRSLSGEANFNWRFIFRFDYLASEDKVVFKETSLFSSHKLIKRPCRLILQVWDNNPFTRDDFLGVATLELAKLPRGARSSKTCNLLQLHPNSGFLNLFKTRRTKGWWPLKNFDLKTSKEILVGAVELEFELLTEEDAEKSPAGLGRNDPQGLPKPNRPDTSFSWFKNPLSAVKYSMKIYKRKIIKLVVFTVLILIVAALCYALQKYGIKAIYNRIKSL